MKYRQINIKEDMPTSDYAIHLMLEEIEVARFSHVPVVVVIHGYGSHGKGGVISKRVQEELSVLKQQGKIVDYVAGQNWSEENSTCKVVNALCPDIQFAHDLHLKNSGVSVILVTNE